MTDKRALRLFFIFSLKEKQKMQKTTEEGKTSSSVDSRLKISGMTEGDGCLIKDFRHDG